MRGKVVLVAFPFDDLSGTKVRPAVCVLGPARQRDVAEKLRQLFDLDPEPVVGTKAQR